MKGKEKGGRTREEQRVWKFKKLTTKNNKDIYIYIYILMYLCFVDTYPFLNTPPSTSTHKIYK